MEFDFQSFISNVGLPGAICIYTLVYVRKSLDANTKVLTYIAAKLGTGGKSDVDV